MDADDVEKKCIQLSSYRERLQNILKEFKDLSSKIQEDEEQTRYLQTLAKLSGKPYEQSYQNEDFVRVQNEIEDCEKNITQFNREILEGLKDIKFDYKFSVPKIDVNTIIQFEKTYPKVINFIASIINSQPPIIIDNVELNSENIIIKNASKLSEVTQILETFHNNIRRLAQKALQENDPTVDNTVNYFHESRHKEIWELIRGRKQITTQKLYKELNLETQKERKNLRNFFTNLQKTLKNNYPFLQIGSGSYELNFFGTLVWSRYQDIYFQKDEVDGSSNERITVQTSNEKRNPILNSFLTDKEIKDTLYGKEVVD